MCVLPFVKLDNPLNQLPLFGHFCCRLAAQPDIFSVEGISGHLKFKKVIILHQHIAYMKIAGEFLLDLKELVSSDT